MTCDCMLWMDHAYNKKCDDVLNTEECFWDNGDCCRYPRFLGDCENCTCHEDPFKALFGQLFFVEMDRKMEKESTFSTERYNHLFTLSCHLVIYLLLSAF